MKFFRRFKRGEIIKYSFIFLIILTIIFFDPILKTINPNLYEKNINQYSIKNPENPNNKQANEITYIHTNSPTPSNIQIQPSDTFLSISPTQFYEEYRLQIGGWIPSFDFNNSYQKALNNDEFNSVSIVYFSLSSNGTLTNRINLSKDKIQNLKNSGKEVFITSTLFSPDVWPNFANSPSLIKNHNQKLLDEVMRLDANGVDIDYESIPLQYKNIYVELITDLSKKFKEKNKKISIVFLPRSSEKENIGCCNETKQSQMIEQIEPYVDEIRIMLYDYHKYVGKEGLSPISWIKSVTSYFSNQMQDKQKLVICLPRYGYSFRPNNDIRAYTDEQIKQIISQNPGLKVEITSENESFFILNQQRYYFLDDDNIEIIKNYLKDQNIEKIYFWRI